MNDRDFMQLALALARQGEGYTSPNPMVGAVLVKDGEIVGRGYHQAAGEPHAEVNAVADAGPLAHRATLYVTLEPCNHTGRTPPCTHTILNAGIQRVIIAMRDPNPDVTGNGIEFLKSKGLDVTVGLCEPEAQRLIESFSKYIRTKRPFVILKCAATLDGRIATRTGDSKWVTGPAARQRVHQIRHAVDAIMVGNATVMQDNPSLTTRLEGREGSDPVRIVLDTHLSISPQAQVLHLESKAGTILVKGDTPETDAVRTRREALEARGANVVQAPIRNGLIDLDRLMVHLGQQGVTSLLVEGGGRVLASALAAKIADKIVWFYAPKILGGDDGVPICRGAGPTLMQDCFAVKHLHVETIGDDVMIEGYLN
jgi:diaminohydroxyphosphoribosylaminopyrimidine deaminase/5-amino-6-(5-phosphoribosylamino)uracil reductase